MPAPHGVSLTTTSSVKPNQRVVSVASMRPLDLSAVTISQPCDCATRARARTWPRAASTASRAPGQGSLLLQQRELRRSIEPVRRVGSLREDGLEGGRVIEIGRDVVDRRQLLRSPLRCQRNGDGGDRSAPAPRRSCPSTCGRDRCQDRADGDQRRGETDVSAHRMIS